MAAGNRADSSSGDGASDPATRISTRAAVVVLASLVCGAMVGGLTWWSGRHPAEVVLAGLVALGGAFPALDRLIR